MNPDIKADKKEITETLLEGLPEPNEPVLIRIENKLYPYERFAKIADNCLEELLARIVNTSQSPQSIIKRITVLKENPSARATIWAEAAMRMLHTDPLSQDDIKKSKQENYKILDLA